MGLRNWRKKPFVLHSRPMSFRAGSYCIIKSQQRRTTLNLKVMYNVFSLVLGCVLGVLNKFRRPGSISFCKLSESNNIS